jgi:hypothetical protein
MAVNPDGRVNDAICQGGGCWMGGCDDGCGGPEKSQK